VTDVVVAPAAELATAFRRRFEVAARDAIATHGTFACALPGGSVAETFLPALTEAAVDWARVHLFWGDERAVPPDDPQSNYGAARRWLDHLPIDAANIHRIHAEDPDLERAAASYESTLTSRLGSPPVLDIVLLGVGPDGHVCSLFPGHPATRERARWVVAVRDAPKPPPVRVTITLPAIAAARSIVMAAFGAEKAGAIREALEDDDSQTPAAVALRSGPPVLVLVDQEAARDLERKHT
jgi:6-phosphogluconolactonase